MLSEKEYEKSYIGSVNIEKFFKKSLKERIFSKRFLYLALAMIIPSALAGMRDFSIGTDINVYGNYWFENTHKVPFVTYMKWTTSSDIGFLYALLNYVVSLFTENSHWFYFALSLLTNIFVYLAVSGFRGEISVPFAMFVYYILFFNSSLNILRQSIAISVIIFSYRYLARDDIKKFLILWIVACLFHSSAMIMIVLLLILKISRLNNRKMLSAGLFVITVAVMLSYTKVLGLLIKSGILSERYMTYLGGIAAGGRLIRLCFYGILFMFILFTYNVLINRDRKNIVLVNCSLLSVAFSILLFIGNNQIIRIAYYFDASLIFVVPMVAKTIVLEIEEGRKNKLIYLVLGALFLVYWILTIVVQNNGQTYPYISGV